MKDNRLGRLMTVALLATWSPGSWWCCCSADAAEPAPETVAATDDADAHGCCSASEVPAPVATFPAAHGDGGDDGCCPVNSDEAPSCGCLHGPSDAALPAAALTAPTGHGDGPDLDLLAELSPAVAFLTTPAHPGSTCRGSPRSLSARSLLSLHCMLTT
ncbi:MAG: hypothetical protein ACYSU7_13010 [Planctomycetota bacterium]